VHPPPPLLASPPSAWSLCTSPPGPLLLLLPPPPSAHDCFGSISTVSLMGVVEALKAGFRLPPPPLPPLVQPIMWIQTFTMSSAENESGIVSSKPETQFLK
jgi:hypothetical protein